MFRRATQAFAAAADFLDDMLVGDPEEFDVDGWSADSPQFDEWPGDQWHDEWVSDESRAGDESYAGDESHAGDRSCDEWHGVRVRRAGALVRSIEQVAHDRRPGQVPSSLPDCLTPVGQQRCDSSRGPGR